MDDHEEDFEDKIEKDEVDALDEEELLLGVGEEDDAPTDDNEESLDKFGFHHDDEDETSDF